MWFGFEIVLWLWRLSEKQKGMWSEAVEVDLYLRVFAIYKRKCWWGIKCDIVAIEAWVTKLSSANRCHLQIFACYVLPTNNFKFRQYFWMPGLWPNSPILMPINISTYAACQKWGHVKWHEPSLSWSPCYQWASQYPRKNQTQITKQVGKCLHKRHSNGKKLASKSPFDYDNHHHHHFLCLCNDFLDS